VKRTWPPWTQLSSTRARGPILPAPTPASRRQTGLANSSLATNLPLTVAFERDDLPNRRPNPNTFDRANPRAGSKGADKSRTGQALFAMRGCRVTMFRAMPSAELPPPRTSLWHRKQLQFAFAMHESIPASAQGGDFAGGGFHRGGDGSLQGRRGHGTRPPVITGGFVGLDGYAGVRRLLIYCSE
jgi:hypothetical protein